MSTLTLMDLSERVARGGISADPRGITELAETAQRLGIRPVLVDVLLDEAQPEVARLRAFTRVSCAVSKAHWDRVAA